MENVKVAPSPLWMQYRLNSLGVNPINNLVDVTNYVLCELGQPMHAYDADLLGDTIVVRAAHKGESILALNGEKYSLSPEDIVIADAHKPVGIAGIIGGNDTAIRASTTRIVLEAASFPAAQVRKSSSRLKLRTDASMRFEKGQDPENTVRALARAVELLQQISPGCEAAPPIDVYARKSTPPKIQLDIDWAERKLGRKLSTEEVINIFKSLVFGVEQLDQRKLLLTVPSWRATKDISIPEDLVEEIGRMVGYASIVPQAPAVLAAPTPRNLDHEQHRAIRAAMVGQGFTEVSNYSFISDADAAMFGYSTDKLLQVANPIIADQKYMRPALLPGIRRNLADNSRYFTDFRLFEIGRAYSKGADGAPKERTHLMAAIYGRETNGANLLEMKRVIQYVAANARSCLRRRIARPCTRSAQRMLKSAGSAWAIFMSCIPDCWTAAAPPSLTLILMRCKLCRHSARHIVRCAASPPAASIFRLSRRCTRSLPTWKTNCASLPAMAWPRFSFC